MWMNELNLLASLSNIYLEKNLLYVVSISLTFLLLEIIKKKEREREYEKLLLH